MVNGFSDAFLQGIETVPQLREQRRQRREARAEDARRAGAFNALAEGDIARAAALDPALAGQAQRVQQAESQFARTEQNAISDRQQDLALKATQFFEQGVARGADPATLAQQGVAVFSQFEDPELVTQFFGQLAQNPDSVGDIRTALQGRQGTPAKLQVGVDPETGERTFFRQDAQGNPVIVSGVNPDVDTDGQIDALRAENIRSQIRTREGQQGLREEKATRDEVEAARKKEASLGNVVRAGRTVVRDANTALELMENTPSFKGGTISAADRFTRSKVIGQPEFEVVKLIDSIKSNVGVDSLLNIKREGSGLGQVPQSQLETLQGLLGKLDIERDPALLRRDIVEIVQLYEEIVQRADGELNEARVVLGRNEESSDDGNQNLVALADFLAEGE